MERKILFMSPAWSSQGKAAEGGSQASPLPLFFGRRCRERLSPYSHPKKGRKNKNALHKKGGNLSQPSSLLSELPTRPCLRHLPQQTSEEKIRKAGVERRRKAIVMDVINKYK